ncbi:MAG: OmpH family outer membrane protein [Bacteroidia bacterium]
MKKLIFILLAVFGSLTTTTSFAQKFAYVDTEYMLGNIAEYKSAQQQLDQLSVQWQKEIETRYAQIDKLYKAYQAEQILLTEEMRKKREDEILNKEKEVKDFQKEKFGYQGDLFKKKQELVKPIQDKIYNAVKKFAEDNSYAFIFDKSSDLIMLFANARYDKSDDILKAMGYTAGTTDTKTGTSGTTSGSGGSTGRTETPAGGTPKANPTIDRK